MEIFLFIIALLAACGCGHLMLRFLRMRCFQHLLEREVAAVALGVMLFAFATLFLAVTRLLIPRAAWAAFVILIVAGAIGFILRRDEGKAISLSRRRGKRLSIFSIGILTVLIAYAVFNMINGLVPTLNHDTLDTYFLCPKVWIQNNSITDIAYIFNDNLILWIPLLHSFFMLLDSDVLAKLFDVYLMGLLSAMVVFMLSRRYFKTEISLLSAAVFYSGPCCVWLNESGRNNLAMAFFELLAIYCFFAWLDSQRGKEGRLWVGLAGIFSGFAAGIHVAGFKTVLVIGFCIAAVCAYERRGVRSISKTVALFGVLAVLVASPLFIRNIFVVGNPAFPFLRGVFGGPDYRWIAGEHVLRRGQADVTVRDFFLKLYDITVKPWSATRSLQICPLIIMFVPLIMLIRRPARQVFRFLGIALLLYVAWFFTQRFARYGLNFISLLSIVAAYSACALMESRRRIIAVVAAAVVVFTLIAGLKRDIYRYNPDMSRVKCALGLMDRDDFIYWKTAGSAFYPNYRICQFINSNIGKDAVIFGTSEPLKYWIDAEYLSVREPSVEALYYQRSPQEMLMMMKSRHISHVLFSKRYIDEVNRFMRLCGATDGDFYPEESIFLNEEFRERHLKKLFDDNTDILFEVVYPDENIQLR